jgi:NAD(P)H dehydrogenase (quinone)
VLPPFVAWHVPYISAEARAQVLDDYRLRIEELDVLEPLVFPRLEHFDAKLNPLQTASA